MDCLQNYRESVATFHNGLSKRSLTDFDVNKYSTVKAICHITPKVFLVN